LHLEKWLIQPKQLFVNVGIQKKIPSNLRYRNLMVV